MSSALNDNGLLEPVFAVEDVNDEFDLDIPPTSGMEYLKRVQWVIIQEFGSLLIFVLKPTLQHG